MNRTEIAAQILTELINSDQFAPNITESDVIEDPDNGYLVQRGNRFVNPPRQKGAIIKGKEKTFAVISPEALYCRHAVKFADKLIEELNKAK